MQRAGAVAAFRRPLLAKAFHHSQDHRRGFRVHRIAVRCRKKIAFEVRRRRIEIVNRAGLVHQAKGFFVVAEVQFIYMRERIGNVPTSPSFDHRKPTEPLFAYFQFLQNSKRRDGRREAVLASFDKLRASGDLDI